MKLLLLLFVCSFAFADPSQGQASPYKKSDDATKNTERDKIDMAELLKSIHTRIGTSSEPQARKDNVITNSRILVNIEKFMTADGESASSAVTNKDKALSNGQCGKVKTSGPSARIIGGENADVGEWPWQAMILRDYYGFQYFVCGGSLIGSQWVLSAAHCFDTTNPTQITIALGARFQDLSGSNVKIFAVSAVLCHSDYDDYTNENDICLVKLVSEVEYTNYISPICLPSSSEDNVIAGETCVITGWGVTQGTGNSSVLQEAYVEVFSRENCTDWYAEDYVNIPDGHICAGTTDASKAACYGDSGGPLACSRFDGGESFSTLFGITSFGSSGCLNPNRPTVFTNVAYYLDWIEETKENGVNVCYDLSSFHSCGTIIATNNSRIRSPIADNTTWLYPDDVDCSWIVQAPAGYVVKIEFLCYFETYYSCQDYLEIKPESGRDFKLCGSHYVQDLDPLVTESRIVNLTFHSDSYRADVGFVVQVSFVEAYDGQCGVGSAVSDSSLINGGSPTSVKEWPWQASILVYDENSGFYSSRCGGTLINNKWILSSARCFEKTDPALYSITLGDSRYTWTYIIFAVESIMCHEQYDGTTAENNICLVKLVENVTFSSYIRPACLPDKDDQVENGVNCTITGHGYYNGYYYYLQEAEVDIIPRQDCVSRYKEDGITVTEENFCAGKDEYYFPTSPCEGDYGGPLVCKLDGRSFFTVMGVANFARGYEYGYRYCEGPGVFTEVARYSDWIEQTMASTQDDGVCFDSSTIRACGSTISAANTIIRSPVVDEESWQYPTNRDCEWIISAPADKRVKVQFICFFNVENRSPSSFCANDYLSIEETTKSARYCGLRNVDELEPYVTERNEVKLRFHSDYSYVTQGFVLRISFVTNDGPGSESTPVDWTSTASKVESESAPADRTSTASRVGSEPAENNASLSEQTPGNGNVTISPRVASSTTSGGDRTSIRSILGIIVALVWAHLFGGI